MGRVAFLFILIFLNILSFSFADEYYWNDSSGGELGDSSKWLPTGTPGEDDYVYFTLPNSYTIWLDNDYTHDRMTVDGSDITLDLRGYTYFLDGLADYSRSAVIGNMENGSVTAFGGGVCSGDMFLGWNSSQSTGRLNLSGTGTSWSGYINDGWHGFFYGNSGNAQVSVTDNAYLEHGHGQSGIYRKALFDVDGIDTEWFVAGYFGMSMWGDTTLNLSNGARARFGYLEMAVFPGSSATINVTGTGHQTELVIENYWWDDVSLYIGRGGTGIINLTGSKLLHIGHTVIAENGGSIGQLNIYDGSWADCQGSVAVGGSLDGPGGKGLIYLYDDPYNDIYADLMCAREEEGQFLVVWPEGTIRMDGGEITMNYDADMANSIDLRGGTLEGWGWIYAHVNNYGGVVMPGALGDWKLLDIKYAYQQDADATLKIPIVGASDGGWNHWNYGGLQVNGQAMLDGFLDVDLWNNYVPDYTDEYVIIEAQSVSGRFINAVSEYVFEGGTFEVVYEPDRVILTHFQSEPRCVAPPAADLTGDCKVDFADFVIMAEQWLECTLEPVDFCPGAMLM